MKKENMKTEHKKILCTGCGIPLQNDERDKPGFIPTASVFEEAICQRCFRIRHYNEGSISTVDQNEFLQILHGIGQTNSLVVHIVDLFDFQGTIISSLNRFVGNNPILLVVNKIDLLPVVSNWNRLHHWVQQRVKEAGLKVVDIILCSAKKNKNFPRLIEALQKAREDRDMYVVGATNVGKSTFINRFITDYSDFDKKLTVSYYPGTTLRLVHIPLSDGNFMIDTPGIVSLWRMSELVGPKTLRQVLPKHPLKPITYQLKAGQTLFIGGLVRLDFVEGDSQSFTLYISNQLNVHRTKSVHAEELYERHRGRMLSPPDLTEIQDFPSWTKHLFHFPLENRNTLYISGLGWIKMNGTQKTTIRLHAPKGIKVEVGSSLL